MDAKSKNPGHAVWVVDDDPSVGELVGGAMGPKGYAVEAFSEPEHALETLQSPSQPDVAVLLTDLQLEGKSGLDLCRRICELRPDVPVVVVTAFGSMESAVAAIRAGAYDFIAKPIDLQELGLILQRAVRHRELTREVHRLRSAVLPDPEDMLGSSAGMRQVFDLMSRVATSDATVLITGESGTGKELVAKAIHGRSGRSHRAFVPVNCAAMPGTLLESELFGHTKGAFTDARSAREGLFQAAQGGTLFLDEIGEMPMEMQPKLLRALQDRAIRPVGGDAEMPVDVRILAATHRDLEAQVEAGTFREDLFYRINVVQLPLPPLRARGNDVLLLAQKFVRKYASKYGKPVTGVSGPAAQKLLDYEWPGNVRELENCMERAVTLTRFDQVMVDDLPEKVQRYQAAHLVIADDAPLPTLEDLERRYIHKVLRAVGGNKTQAAKVLGLDRKTLYRKLERIEEERA
ncbi:MAG TPA: sigma-54 dependent transcriptional regulator [Myxococcales bacterium LLY-WYZ-16_1]|nr:sigma-54 dependent transcriptional regulator [Myxococcales bacterium LLY-WYZ-16_1]